MVTHSLSKCRNFGDTLGNTYQLFSSIFYNWEYFIFDIRVDGLSFGLSPGELPCIYFDWFLVCGVSLPVAQLFVIAIEEFLWRGAGSLSRQVER